MSDVYGISAHCSVSESITRPTGNWGKETGQCSCTDQSPTNSARLPGEVSLQGQVWSVAGCRWDV